MTKKLLVNKKYFIKDYDDFRKQIYDLRDMVYITGFYQFKNKKPVKLILFDVIQSSTGFYYSSIKFEKQKSKTHIRNEELHKLFVSYFQEYFPFLQEEMEI